MNSIQRARISKEEVLSHQKYLLKKITFDYQRSDQTWQTQIREVYDRGDGAAILLYSAINKCVILTKQFRLPSFINGNTDGMMIEACAGLLDDDNPEDCIKREAEEETGYTVKDVRKIFEAFMSPGALTEKIHFFIGEYFPGSRVSEGGGLEQEGEDIEVLEIPFDEAFGMIEAGKIMDAKTIMLLLYGKLNGIL